MSRKSFGGVWGEKLNFLPKIN